MILSIMMQFENLPNEILISFFDYLHIPDLFFSFDQINHRFNELIQTFPWHLDFQHIRKSVYDTFCQRMLINPEVQKQVYSLRLSNKDTPGQINDFLSNFSLDQFSHLRSLIFIDLRENNIPQLQEIFPKLSQITTLRLLKSEIDTYEFESLIPIDHLQTLSINSELYFVHNLLPLKSFTTTNISLNDICRLLSYTPCLEYVNISNVREISLSDEYYQSSRPVNLKCLILTDFRAKFADLVHLLRNMDKLRSLTTCSSSDPSWVDASRWEQLITSSLPSLKHFRFRSEIFPTSPINTGVEIFERFQTDFWLKEHHWPVEVLIEQYSITIYTTPYSSHFPQISLNSRRLSNPLFDDTQTFKHVHALAISANELLQYGKFYFPNVTSLIFADSFEITSENNEQSLMESLNSLLNLSSVKHLKIPLDYPTERASLFLQILQSTPQLSSLRINQYVFEILATNLETSGYFKNKIRNLFLEHYGHYESRPPFQMNLLTQSFPNLEQLRMSSTQIDDLYILLNHSSRLSTFTLCFVFTDYPQELEKFKKHASERGVIIDETMATYRGHCLVNVSVWL